MSQIADTESRFTSTVPASDDLSLGALSTAAPASAQSEESSLFERFSRVYVFFREKCFRDDTDRIIRALWSDRAPASGTRVVELGCGPGFYSCQLAARHPQLSVVGVDCSARQLEWARKKAQQRGLENCRFESNNVLALSHPDASCEVVLAARLFTVLPDQKRALAEMHRILNSDGRCLIAEPRYAFWASLPLFAMWMLAAVTGMNNRCREPRRATVLSDRDFQKLFASQPWRTVKTWQDGRYQYALCEKV